MKSTKDRIILQNYPTYQQISKKNYAEMNLSEELNVNFFKNIGWYVDSSENHQPFKNYDEIKIWLLDNLEQNIPVMIKDEKYSEHWRVIIGYDKSDEVLFFADSKDGYKVENACENFSMWLDNSQQNQQWLIARPKTVVEEQNSKISLLLENSQTAQKTNQIILAADHNLSLWNKKSDKWTMIMQSYCGYGQNGLNTDKREGDRTTPIGSFPILFAFGFDKNFDTKMNYRHVTPNSHISSKQDETYNTWNEVEGGGTLIKNTQFKYGMFIGYNTNPIIKGKGSGILLHCKNPEYWWTRGCISLPERKMVEVLKQAEDGCYIIIVPSIKEIKNF